MHARRTIAAIVLVGLVAPALLQAAEPGLREQLDSLTGLSEHYDEFSETPEEFGDDTALKLAELTFLRARLPGMRGPDDEVASYCSDRVLNKNFADRFIRLLQENSPDEVGISRLNRAIAVYQDMGEAEETVRHSTEFTADEKKDLFRRANVPGWKKKVHLACLELMRDASVWRAGRSFLSKDLQELQAMLSRVGGSQGGMLASMTDAFYGSVIEGLEGTVADKAAEGYEALKKAQAERNKAYGVFMAYAPRPGESVFDMVAEDGAIADYLAAADAYDREVIRFFSQDEIRNSSLVADLFDDTFNLKDSLRRRQELLLSGRDAEAFNLLQSLARQSAAGLYSRSPKHYQAISYASMAAELKPRNEESLLIVARSSIAVGRFSDAIDAYEMYCERTDIRFAGPVAQAVAMLEWQLDFTRIRGYGITGEDLTKLGFAYAVRGDYDKALYVYRAADEFLAAREDMHNWRIVMAYAASDLTAAARVWKSWKHDTPGNYLSRRDLMREVANIVFDGLVELAASADDNGMRYASLKHNSVNYRLVGEESVGYSDRWRKAARKDLQASLFKAYKQLPLKPSITGPARRHALAAQQHLEREEWGKAFEAYQQVTEHAPWWPEGHYNTALMYGVMGATPAAVREMKLCLELVQGGPRAVEGREKLSSWQESIRAAVARGAKEMPDSDFLRPPIGNDVKTY